MATLRFNVAIARIAELTNHLTQAYGQSGPVPRGVCEWLTLLVAPLAPHLAEELWARLGNDGSLAWAAFPVADPALLVDDTVEVAVQVNGKVRAQVAVPADADADALEAAARADERIAEQLAGRTVRRVDRGARAAGQLRRRVSSAGRCGPAGAHPAGAASARGVITMPTPSGPLRRARLRASRAPQPAEPELPAVAGGQGALHPGPRVLGQHGGGAGDLRAADPAADVAVGQQHLGGVPDPFHLPGLGMGPDQPRPPRRGRTTPGW